MFRPMIAASVFALVLASPAMAQVTAPAAPTQLEQSGLTPPAMVSEGFATQGEDVLVTKLLGQTVYSSIDDNAEEIGKISNMVVTSGLGISAVVISVGGFLGVGEKEVAVDFAELDWASREDGSRRWVLATTAEALSAAPAFIWADSEEATGQPALTRDQQEEQLVDGDPNAVPVDPTLTTDQPERTTISTPVDRTGFSAFDKSGLTADDLRGIGVYGIDDQQIGAIGDIVTNPDGTFDAVIVDVGGFLGLGAKPVAVGFENLAFSADTFGHRYLFLNTTREQLENQPTYDPQTYAGERDTQRMVITP
ncbi:PRC-barrel domain-containing protein [Devosia sp. 2618]|uniref:PRC-barrel domain-containing protein n=1 Tax=Devosia sp. 2618 TaxID=3156454 RepID=UPI0033995FBC